MIAEFKYFAFISYNSKDTAWGKRLQKKLEHYKLPATLCSEKGWARTPIRPVFFAPTDIQPGTLSEELKERLNASRYLIVICSPNSAQSKWVGEEIAYFHSIGREKNILFFIVDGSPNSGDSKTECFNPIIKELNIPEILGANINEKIYRYPWLNKERAYVQLVSKLLEVEYDSIWQRHKRILTHKITGTIICIISVLGLLLGALIMSQPVDIAVKLNEGSASNNYLPPLHNAIISLILDNEIKRDTLPYLDREIYFTNVPHKFYGKEVKLSVRGSDFNDLDTTVILNKKLNINIYRNPAIYGNVSFVLWNDREEQLVPDIDVSIEGLESKSDKNGRVNIFIPLEKQRTKYKVESGISLLNDTVYMPCGDNFVILVK